ncbi:MAG TPA: molybdopterin cofactor-binding domain-containing protein [Herpetosiphonaceae bacterium]
MSDAPSDTERLARTAAESERRRVVSGPDAPLISDWLHIAADSSIEVYTGKVEVGQNIRTSLAQAVAQELCVLTGSITLIMADTDRTPFDPGTFGSQTTPIMSRRLRAVAASARELLIDRAAARWQCDRGGLSVDNGQLIDRRTGRALSFGELTQGQPLDQPYDPDAPLTPAHAWTIAGTDEAKVAGRAIVTGAHRYTPDLLRPGMWAGAVLRPAAFGATLKTLDTSAAESLPDVSIVRDGELVGVVAPDRTRAIEAVQALRAEWTTTEQPSSGELFDYLRTHPAPPPEDPRIAAMHREERGAIEAGFAAGAHTLEQSYTHAYIAHAPLEPRAAVAEWHEGQLTVWTGTQRPFGVRGELATAFDLPEEQVRVIVPDTGSAYGGKHTGEVAVEAARLARAAGRPIKLIWTREEEFSWAYLRPAGVIEIRSAVRQDATISAWEFHNYNSGAAGMRTPYAVPHQRIIYHPSQSPLRQGSYRALAATANTFARESHMDDLAALLGIDPLEFRLKNLRDERLRAVLQAAADHFGWGESHRGAGHGVGIAGGTEKGSYVATCVEVRVDPESGQVRIVRIVQAFECGAVINPNGLRNQVEGAIIQGLGGALFEAIDFADGQIRNNRFSRYRVPRFADVPAIETVLLDRQDLPSAGAGETPIIGIAPAIGNAIFNATGRRLRSLPLLPEDRLPS